MLKNNFHPLLPLPLGEGWGEGPSQNHKPVFFIASNPCGDYDSVFD
jgi:hypothetical protein